MGRQGSLGLVPMRHCERRPARVVILSGELRFRPGEREGGKKVSSSHVWFRQLWLILHQKEEKTRSNGPYLVASFHV